MSNKENRKEVVLILKEEAQKIYDATKAEIEKRKKEAEETNYSPEKQAKFNEALEEAEQSLENLKKFIENPFRF